MDIKMKLIIDELQTLRDNPKYRDVVRNVYDYEINTVLTDEQKAEVKALRIDLNDTLVALEKKLNYVISSFKDLPNVK